MSPALCLIVYASESKKYVQQDLPVKKVKTFQICAKSKKYLRMVFSDWFLSQGLSLHGRWKPSRCWNSIQTWKRLVIGLWQIRLETLPGNCCFSRWYPGCWWWLETLDLAKNLHVLRDQVDGDGVLSSPRNNHIRIFFCRQAELFKGRLHQGSVLGRWNDNLSYSLDVLYQGLFRLLQGFYLLKDMLKVPSPVPDVPHNSPWNVWHL